MTTDKLQWLRDELGNLRQQGLYNNIRTIDSAQGAWLTVDGKRVLNFCSNNYLGLANDERLRTAAKAAIDKYGVGPAAVRTIAGTLSLHGQLEERSSHHFIPVGLHLQPGHHHNAGREGGCHLLG